MHEFMKRIRKATTNEELKEIAREFFILHANGNLSDAAFGELYDETVAKKEELSK